MDRHGRRAGPLTRWRPRLVVPWRAGPRDQPGPAVADAGGGADRRESLSCSAAVRSSIVTTLHGVLGIALVCLVPWKSVIARRGLRRHRVDRYLSLLLALAVLVALVSGFAQSTGLLVRFDGLDAIQVHVGASLVALADPRRTRVAPADQAPPDGSVPEEPAAPRGRSVSRPASATSCSRARRTCCRCRVRTGARRGPTSCRRAGPQGMPSTIWLLDGVPTIAPERWHVVVSVGGRDPALECRRASREIGDRASVAPRLHERLVVSSGVDGSAPVDASADRDHRYRRSHQRHRLPATAAAVRRPAARGGRRRPTAVRRATAHPFVWSSRADGGSSG